MSQNTEFWIAVGSAGAAWTAAIFAYRSYRIARRSLELSEKQDKARIPQLVPYLITGFYRQLEKGPTRLYAFSISMSNRSDNENSISLIELQITYTRSNNVSNNLVLPHESNLADHFRLIGAEPLTVPIHINSHQTIAGWIYFKLDYSSIGNIDIDRYKIRFLDSHGKESYLEPIIIREIIDEERLAQGLYSIPQ